MNKYTRLMSLALAILISVLIFLNRDKFGNLESYGYVGIFLISVLGNATIVLPVPVILTAFLGGGIFNPLAVAVVTSLGATIGELTGYMAGISGRGLIENKGKIEKVKNWMSKHGLWTLFVLAVIPNPLFDLAGIVAGATRIPVYKYLIVVWLGKLIKFLVFSFLGAGVFRWNFLP